MQYQIVPYKFGVILDWGRGTQIAQDYLDAMRMGFEENAESKLLDRAVDLVVREVDGPPVGEIAPIVDAWRELANKELPMAIVGPSRSEAAKVLREEITATAMPTVSHCGTLDFGGHFNFSIGNGAFGDEAPILSDFHRRRSHKVGVIREANVAGDETFASFRLAAREHRTHVVGDQLIDNFASVAAISEQLKKLHAAGADAVQYFGNGTNAKNFVTALNEVAKSLNWKVTKVLNTAFVLRNAGWGDAAIPQAELEGWIGLDQISERNKVCAAMLDRFEKRYGRRPFHAYAAIGWDTANVLAIGTARSKPHWREGFKVGLEKVRWLPSAVGGPASFISIGLFDHRGYKGNYLLLREIRNGVDQIVDIPTLLTE
jgi:ABC-type branched-subunit amino acid transport system substrate-binding protein